MISFIIIGRNEGWRLTNCIRSIINSIEYNKNEAYEIIYVDSNSTDNSVERAKEFGIVKIFKLVGDMNAAIARNVGAEEAKGDVFFFIDGDMEINKEAFSELFKKDMKLKYDFISGDFQDFNYENKGSKECIDKEMYHKNRVIKKEFITGGLFVIDKKVWFSVHGMRNVFIKGEDMDLGLRLSKKGIFLYRLPINLANHHTVSYHDKNRMWSEFLDSTPLFSKALLYRKNLFNLNTWKLIMKQDYTLFILIISIVISLLFRKVELMLIYIIALILRSILKKDIKYLLYYLLRDIMVLTGGFIFFPKKNFQINYSEI